MKRILFMLLLAPVTYLSAQENQNVQPPQDSGGYISVKQAKSPLLTKDKLEKQQEHLEKEHLLQSRAQTVSRGLNTSRATTNRDSNVICAGEETSIEVRIYPLDLPIDDFYAVWDFGDGTPLKTSVDYDGRVGTIYEPHTYTMEGNYRVMVKLYDLQHKQIVGTKGDTAQKAVVVESCTLPQLPVNPNIHLVVGN